MNTPVKANPADQSEPAASRCPLCHQPNDCQLCTSAAYQGACWCAGVEIPEALLAQVPLELQNQACICRACVDKFRPG